MLGHGTTGCDALTESISCTTPTWAGAWELMQCSVSGRKTVIQRSSSKNLIKSLHPSSGSSSALTVLTGCGISSSVFLLPTISFLVRGGLSHTAKKEFTADLEVLRCITGTLTFYVVYMQHCTVLQTGCLSTQLCRNS